MALFLLFLCWPLAELFVAIEVANAIGVFYMLVLLVIGWPIGVWAIRSQGQAVMRRLSLAISEGRPPAKEAIDGALVLLGGTLLIIPGFITDALGVLALLPPTRVALRALVIRNFRSRLVMRAIRFAPGGRAYDVDSTAHDVDPPHLRA